LTGTSATDRESQMAVRQMDRSVLLISRSRSRGLQIRQVDGSSLLEQSFYGIYTLILSSVKEIGQPGGRGRASREGQVLG